MEFRAIVRLLVQDSFLYGLSSAFSRAAAIITLPLITSFLTKEEYASYDMLRAFAASAGAVVVLGQDSAIVRFLFDTEKNDITKKSVASIGLLIQFVSFLLVVGLIWLTQNFWLFNVYSGNTIIVSNFHYALLFIPGQALNLYSLTLFKWTFRRYHFITVALLDGSLALAIVWLIANHSDHKLNALIKYLALSPLLVGLFSLLLNKRYISFSSVFKDLRLWREMSSYGLIFMFIMLSTVLVANVDRYFLVKYTSYLEIANYALAFRVMSIFSFLISAFSIAFGPFSFSIWGKSDAPVIFGRILNLYLLGVTGIFLLLLSIAQKLIIFFGGNAYLDGLKYLPILFISVIFEGLTSFSLIGLYYKKKSMVNLVVVLAGLLMLIFANLLLVPYLKALGSAISFLIAKATIVVVSSYFSSKYFHIPLKNSVLSFIIFTASLGFFLFYYSYTLLITTCLLYWLFLVIVFLRYRDSLFSRTR